MYEAKKCHKIFAPFLPLLNTSELFRSKLLHPPFFGSQKTDFFFFVQRHVEGLLQQTLILKRFQGTLLLFTSRLGEVFSVFFANKEEVWGDERCFFWGCLVFFLKGIHVCGM